MTRMEVRERRVGGATILELKGRLVLEDGAEALRSRIDSLIRRGQTEIILDLGDVTYLDSSGVGAIAAKSLSLRRSGGALKLLRLSERCRHVLGVTGLLGVFKPFESEDAAIRSFRVEHSVVA
jgi:anti-sigma B factor antagonist